MIPERHNAVKVLVFLDVGGSMDPHHKVCEEIFPACRTEFKHLEYFTFTILFMKVYGKTTSVERMSPLYLGSVYKYTPDYKVIL